MNMVLSRQAHDAIRAEACRAFPEEGCGFLVGDEGTHRVAEALARPNVHPGPRATRYRIDGLEYVRLEDELDTSGRMLLGIFHSHPNHPPVPSETDRAVAWPGLAYFIQSVRGSVPSALGELRAWRVDRYGGEFRPVSFSVEEA